MGLMDNVQKIISINSLFALVSVLIILIIKLSHYRYASDKGDIRYSSYSFLTSVLDGGEWSVSCPGCTGMIPGTHWIGGWVSLRASLDTEARGKILCLCQGSNLITK
jgi:hypothetical protein